jgi:hypothetical protein
MAQKQSRIDKINKLSKQLKEELEALANDDDFENINFWNFQIYGRFYSENEIVLPVLETNQDGAIEMDWNRYDFNSAIVSSQQRCQRRREIESELEDIQGQRKALEEQKASLEEQIGDTQAQLEDSKHYAEYLEKAKTPGTLVASKQNEQTTATLKKEVAQLQTDFDAVSRELEHLDKRESQLKQEYQELEEVNNGGSK